MKLLLRMEYREGVEPNPSLGLDNPLFKSLFFLLNILDVNELIESIIFGIEAATLSELLEFGPLLLTMGVIEGTEALVIEVKEDDFKKWEEIIKGSMAECRQLAIPMVEQI